MTNFFLFTFSGTVFETCSSNLTTQQLLRREVSLQQQQQQQYEQQGDVLKEFSELEV